MYTFLIEFYNYGDGRERREVQAVSYDDAERIAHAWDDCAGIISITRVREG